jgi:peptide/nickel transport system substrate-binding protein
MGRPTLAGRNAKEVTMLYRRAALAAAIIALGALSAGTVAAQTLRVGINASDFGTLDPHRATSTTDVVLVSWMFNGLVRFPPGSADPAKIEPDLAESWKGSDDGKTWIFRLRNGVLFQGGYGEMTAHDVVYSLERAKSPDTSAFASDYVAFDKIEAMDPQTVRITLSQPVPGFLGLVANYHGGNIVSRKAVEKLGSGFKTHPIGTGPFQLDRVVTQQYVHLTGFKDYFRGTPKIGEIQYLFIPPDSSRDLAFKSGELDLSYGKREQRWVDQAKTWKGAKVDIFQPGEYRAIYLNMAHPPLDNPKMRRAISHAINVDQIVHFVGADVGPKGCSVVPSGYMGEDCSWAFRYDPGLARKLLAEAGHPNGIKIKAVVSSHSSQLPIMEIIQAQLAEVGIDMQMNVVDHPTYHEQIRKDVSDVVFYGSARFPVADSYLGQFYDSAATVGTPTGVTNFSHCDVADAEIRGARTAATDVERLKLWSEAQRKIHDAVCGVPLFSLLQVWVRSDKLDLGYDLKGSLNLAPPITEKTTLRK